MPQDQAESLKWYHEAAEQGNDEAQYNLAAMYDDGEGTPKNKAEAEKWYRKAAEQGNATAQFHLGVMHYSGDGVPENLTEGYAWFAIAGANGDEDSKVMLVAVKAGLTPDQLAEAQKRATQLLSLIHI